MGLLEIMNSEVLFGSGEELQQQNISRCRQVSLSAAPTALQRSNRGKIKLHSARYPHPSPFQLPDTRQPAHSLADLLTSVVAVLGRCQPHNVPPLLTAQAVHEVVTQEYRILESVNCVRVGDLHASRLGVFLRGSLLLECSAAAIPTRDWLTSLTARASSFRSSCKRGPASCQ